MVTIPLLTFGRLVLGYLVMVGRASGESAYRLGSEAIRAFLGQNR